MMPDNLPSSQVISARYTGARGRATTRTIDYEDGGIAVQDTSQGLLYQLWRARLIIDTGAVILDAPEVPEFTLLTLPGTTEISFTWDQNMRPCMAFVQDGQAKLYWYDSSVAAQVTTNLAADVVSPRVCLDDKRPSQQQISDIILAYKRGDNLYWRMQRERFLTERLWQTGVPPGPLIKLGLNRQLRLQAQVAYE